MEKKRSGLAVMTNGIFKENPVLVLVLGTCPTLAVSTVASNGVGMGLAATFVLICSNMVISALKSIIPEKVRIPCYIVIVAGFVTVVQLIVKAYFPALDKALGVYLPLIVVNCIILGRAEVFASKNGVIASILDGLGMGAGFTLALLAIGSVREIMGSGTWFGIKVMPGSVDSMTIMLLAPGGFFIYGCIIALLNKLSDGRAVKRKSFGCEGCPSAGMNISRSAQA